MMLLLCFWCMVLSCCVVLDFCVLTFSCIADSYGLCVLSYNKGCGDACVLFRSLLCVGCWCVNICFLCGGW
jgi:hypothetical protein